LPVPRLDETTFIHRIFGGYLRSQLRCTKCGYCSNTYDPFLDLALEVSKKSIDNVGTAFLEFTRKETLDSDNRWKCGGCRQYVRAQKALTVFRPPLSLCVQMKRFTFGGLSFGFQSKFGMGQGNKITKPITFPAEMDLPLSDGRSCPYALTGVVIHVGGSSNSGHYTAYVRKPNGGESHQWYHMDDSSVQAVSQKTVLQQKDAYLLFYCRKEVKLEFPPLPARRGSMSAEEAKELGRARARARADSLTNVGESTTPHETLSATAKATPTLKADADDAEMPSNCGRQARLTPYVVNGSNETLKTKAPENIQRVKQKGRRDSSSESESSDHSSSSDDTTTRAASAAAKTSKITAPDSEQGQQAAPNDSLDAPDAIPTKGAKDKLSSSSDSESSSSSASDDSSVDSSANENGCSSGARGKANAASKYEVLNSKQPPLLKTGSDGENPVRNAMDKNSPRALKKTISGELYLPTSRGLSSSNELETRHEVLKPSTESHAVQPAPPPKKMGIDEKKKESKAGKGVTKIVLDRGQGREKVSVMLGRSAKKPWVPQTLGRTASGDVYDLLGNRTIGKWDDDNNNVEKPAEASGAAKARAQIVGDMDKKDRDRRRKALLDRWDQSLDRGRVSTELPFAVVIAVWKLRRCPRPCSIHRQRKLRQRKKSSSVVQLHRIRFNGSCLGCRL
jgi:Ubiquitin carboxyl-terminal hydrolase